MNSFEQEGETVSRLLYRMLHRGNRDLDYKRIVSGALEPSFH